jgi:hypothetical protein
MAGRHEQAPLYVDNVFDKSYQITIEKPMKVILGIAIISKDEMVGKRLIFFMNEVIKSRVSFILEIIPISVSIVRKTWLDLRYFVIRVTEEK